MLTTPLGPFSRQRAPPPLPGTATPAVDPTTGTRSLSEDDRFDIYRYTPVPTLVLDPSLVIRQVSDSYLNVSGCGREQVLGVHADDFFDKRVPVPSISSVRRAIGTAFVTKEPHVERDLSAGGRTAWSIKAIPVFRDGSLWYLQMELENTTKEHLHRVDLEERLAASETFRILVETAKDYAIFMLDTDGKVATWNAGAESFKGYTRQEIIGKHFSSFYSEEDKANDKPGTELAIALRDGRVEDEGWRYRKDGSKFWANVVITPVYKNDVLIGFSKVTRDLTERRKAELRLIDAYEEASKLKSEFLANMSHEIRTPMHGMLAALTLLLDTPLNPEQLDLAKVIEDSGGVLLQVINDILDYSKLASGCFSISADIISVTDIIQSVFRGYEKSHKQGVSLQSYLDPKLPKACEGDSLRYRQIIQNLLSNAFKFTEEGSVRVRATLQKEDQTSYIILTEVIDTGIGIPSNASGSLFTPFSQFDNSATKRFKGTGLGLSICKNLAELMGGHIGFLPNPQSHGSCFWFTAKLGKVKQLKHIDALQESLQSVHWASPSPIDPFEEIKLAAINKKILLAEDNRINQKVMLKMLAGLGFDHIDLAADGKEAVAICTKAPKLYDIILMDINMPVLDGVSATKEIRSAGIFTPIIAMTANALKGQADIYIAKGMTDYIAKPVDRKHLIKTLLKCLTTGEPPEAH